MTTNANSQALDMLTFSGLLRIIRQPQLAENYEARAKYLLSNPAAENVEETREWVRLTLVAGAGGLGDMYVQKTDGSVDRVLTQQYMELLQKMTAFANGGPEPLSPLIQQRSEYSGWRRRLRSPRPTTGHAGVPDDGTPPIP